MLKYYVQLSVKMTWLFNNMLRYWHFFFFFLSKYNVSKYISVYYYYFPLFRPYLNLKQNLKTNFMNFMEKK